MMRIVHHVSIGLGFNGYRAICSCGWRSDLSILRENVGKAHAEHKRRSLLQVVR
jgi:hypothetical protein